MRIRNPDWTRDELLLALEFYLRRCRAQPGSISRSDPELVELSKCLNALPIHFNRPDAIRFRNPNGVSMKVGHFLHVDPAYAGRGLDGCSILDGEVFREFVDDLPRLQQVTDAIRSAAQSRECPWVNLTAPDEPCAVEGHILTRLHVERERDPRIVARKKAMAMSTYGRLACEVCGFDFAVEYGSLGAGFIECHHRRPLHTLRPGDRTRLVDLALVCANCHRMLHRRKRVLALEEIRSALVPSEFSPNSACEADR